MAESITCASVLDGSAANPLPTRFDSDNGTMYILEVPECWATVKASLENSLLEIQNSIQELADLAYETDVVSQLTSEISELLDYTDGIMVYTSWQWDQNELADEDHVGVCYYQENTEGSSTYPASCWEISYRSGSYGSSHSYLIKPNQIGSQAALEEFTPIDIAKPRGTAGSWIVTNPTTAFESTKIAHAIRFSPAESSTADPAIRLGATEAVTYLSSRPTASSVVEETNLFHHLRQGSDSFASNARWSSEAVTLNCYNEATCPDPNAGDGTGATAVTTVAAVLAACVSILAF